MHDHRKKMDDVFKKEKPPLHQNCCLKHNKSSKNGTVTSDEDKQTWNLNDIKNLARRYKTQNFISKTCLPTKSFLILLI